MSPERRHSLRFFTIGVYGWSAPLFFAALRDARIDTFCDIRWRRGVRGSDYAFVNSVRLQQTLGEMGIRYGHWRELAPQPALREGQARVDKGQGTAQRLRTTLSPAFVQGYTQQNLARFDSRGFVARLGPLARNVVLFCVEREPKACHRSLLADRLGRDLGGDIIHLLPGSPPL